MSQEEKTEYLTDFAFRLNTRADMLGLSQADIAAKLGVKPPRVNHWFKGNNLPRSLERAALVKVLQCSAGWLFDGEGTPEQKTDILNPEPGEVPVRNIPLISWTHAGAAVSYEEMPKHWQGTISTMSRDRRAFALIIEGDSMEPKFLAGDRVVCEPSSELCNGKPVVAKDTDDGVVLRIYHKLPNGKIRLAPLNPVYPTIEYKPSAFQWICRVSELNRPI